MDERKYKILIVDDSDINRSMLADILGNDFEIVEARNGIEAVNIIRTCGVEISLVMLDILMPKMDGLEVLAIMNSYKWLQDIPVIMISAENESSYISRAYELGATDYIQRPFDATVVNRRVINAITLYNKQKKLVGLVEEQIYEKQKEQSILINILSNIVEFRNGESGFHILHIYTMTEILLKNLLKISDKYKLSPQEINLIATASALHDIGKIAIDNKILNKPDKLTSEEFEIVKKHTVYGAEMLEKIPYPKSEPLLRVAKEICRWHHERYDGKGYPDGLQGDEIPISAQVVALADVYDALTDNRVYRKAIPHNQAIDMIVNGECGAFNPVLIKALKWASDKIQSELRSTTLNASSRSNVERITREVVSHSDLYVSKSAWELLEQEREKNRFILSDLKEIFFEYYDNPPMLSFTEENACRLGVDTTISDPLNDEKLISCFGKDNLVKIFDLIGSSHRDSPIVNLACEINLNGKLTRCNAVILSQYSFNGLTGKDDFESATGKIQIIN